MAVIIKSVEPGLVHIRIADVAALRLSESYSDMMRLLPSDDRNKISAYAYQKDRLLCMAGRIMMRALAFETAGKSYAPLRFSEFGKPYFEFENAPQFNLSHSGDYVALAYGSCPVGVDIECCNDFEWSDVAEGFSEAERAFIMSDPDRLRCFYRVWTTREAISKEFGKGLSIFDSGAVSIDFENKEAQCNGRKLFFDDWSVSGFVLCVCSQQRFDADIAFVSHEEWQHVMDLLRRGIVAGSG